MATAIIYKMTSLDLPEVIWFSNVADPFEGIFYHLMPAKDSINILFYNKPLFNNILTVLSKQFSFPSETSKTFSVKTHVDGNKSCKLFLTEE